MAAAVNVGTNQAPAASCSRAVRSGRPLAWMLVGWLSQMCACTSEPQIIGRTDEKSSAQSGPDSATTEGQSDGNVAMETHPEAGMPNPVQPVDDQCDIDYETWFKTWQATQTCSFPADWVRDPRMLDGTHPNEIITILLNGSEPTTPEADASGEELCDRFGNAWFFDDYVQPTTVFLCPERCQQLINLVAFWAMLLCGDLPPPEPLPFPEWLGRWPPAMWPAWPPPEPDDEDAGI